MPQKKKKRKKKKNPREYKLIAKTKKTPVVFSQFDCLKISVEILKNIRWHQTNRKYKSSFFSVRKIYSSNSINF